MKDVQPFKEVPDKLIQQITRSFVATRVFVQALGVGRDVLAVSTQSLLSHKSYFDHTHKTTSLGLLQRRWQILPRHSSLF